MEIDGPQTARIAWGVFIVILAVLRWRPNIRSRRVRVKRSHRSPKEQILYAISYTGLVLLPGIWVFGGFPKRLNFEPLLLVMIAGVVLLIVSLILFHLTHKALGAMWSNSLDVREGHRLITTSIYTRLRHPMYTAFWLWAVGQMLILPNWLAAFSGLAGFGLLYFLRIDVEESMMEAEFGQEYRDYVKRTKRIIPGIY